MDMLTNHNGCSIVTQVNRSKIGYTYVRGVISWFETHVYIDYTTGTTFCIDEDMWEEWLEDVTGADMPALVKATGISEEMFDNLTEEVKTIRR